MFRFDVLQNQWLVFAMRGALSCWLVLFSLAMRRPRVEGERHPEEERFVAFRRARAADSRLCIRCRFALVTRRA